MLASLPEFPVVAFQVAAAVQALLLAAFGSLYAAFVAYHLAGGAGVVPKLKYLCRGLALIMAFVAMLTLDSIVAINPPGFNDSVLGWGLGLVSLLLAVGTLWWSFLEM